MLFFAFCYSGIAQQPNASENEQTSPQASSSNSVVNESPQSSVSIPVVTQTLENKEASSNEPVTGETTTLNTGNTAWMLTATALVLFMTLPGLALFYGGLVQSRNVLSVLMQCFAIALAALTTRTARRGYTAHQRQEYLSRLTALRPASTGTGE